MQINSTIALSDILALITLISLIIGGLFSFYQWRRNNVLKRSKYITDLTEKLRTDEDIRSIISLIEYGESWYSENFHGSSEQEAQVDKTLSLFSYICYLKYMKVLSKNEFIFFEYEIGRIVQNMDVINYMYNLYHFSRKQGKKITFYYLLKYAKKNKLISQDFFNNNSHHKSKLYTKVLNF